LVFKDLIETVILFARVITVALVEQGLHWALDLMGGLAIGFIIVLPFFWKWSNGLEALRKK